MNRHPLERRFDLEEIERKRSVGDNKGLWKDALDRANAFQFSEAMDMKADFIGIMSIREGTYSLGHQAPVAGLTLEQIDDFITTEFRDTSALITGLKAKPQSEERDAQIAFYEKKLALLRVFDARHISGRLKRGGLRRRIDN